MKEPFEKDLWPNIKIIGSGTTATVYIDGVKVNRVLGYRVEQNAQDKRMAEVTLTVQCNLDLEVSFVPQLPEPWATFIKDKDGNISLEKIRAVLP